MTTHSAPSGRFGLGISPELCVLSSPAVAIKLRHLKTRSEMESIMHLREEIDLSVHSGVSSNFGELEKKETSAVLSSVSSSMAKR